MEDRNKQEKKQDERGIKGGQLAAEEQEEDPIISGQVGPQAFGKSVSPSDIGAMDIPGGGDIVQSSSGQIGIPGPEASNTMPLVDASESEESIDKSSVEEDSPEETPSPDPNKGGFERHRVIRGSREDDVPPGRGDISGA
jgi:hypothetical protein